MFHNSSISSGVQDAIATMSLNDLCFHNKFIIASITNNKSVLMALFQVNLGLVSFLLPLVLGENLWESVTWISYRLDIPPDTHSAVSKHCRKHGMNNQWPVFIHHWMHCSETPKRVYVLLNSVIHLQFAADERTIARNVYNDIWSENQWWRLRRFWLHALDWHIRCSCSTVIYTFKKHTTQLH